MSKQYKDLLEQTIHNGAVSFRIIGTHEGVVFVSASLHGGAFVMRPGETLVINLDPTYAAVQNPQYSSNPLLGQSGQAGYPTPVGAITAGMIIRIAKETEHDP